MSKQVVVVRRATFQGEILSLPSKRLFVMERLDARRLLSVALDSGFAGDGVLELASGSIITYLDDGRFLSAELEKSSTGASAIVISRHDADGSVDTSFGDQGFIRTLPGSGGNDYLPFTIELDKSGNIVLTGGSDTPAVPSQWSARLSPDGTLDTAFGTNGIRNYIDYDFRLPDGSILRELGRNVGEPLRFSRILADGSVDPTFGINGVLSLPDYAVKSSSLSAPVVELPTTSTDLDTGETITYEPVVRHEDPASYAAHYVPVAVDAQGRIYFSGQAYDNRIDIYGGYSALARATADGQLDTTFGEDGVAWLSEGEGRGLLGSQYMFDSQGRIVVAVSEAFHGFGAGDYHTNVRLYRLLDDGSLDSSFGTNGQVLIDGDTDASAFVRDIRLQDDGKILFVGSLSRAKQFSTPSSTLDVLRFNVDGTADTSFGVNGRFTVSGLFDSNTIELGQVSFSGDALTVLVREYNNNGSAEEASVVRIDLDGIIETPVPPSETDTPESANPSTPASESENGAESTGGVRFDVSSFPIAEIDRSGKALTLWSLGNDILESRDDDRLIDLV